MQTPLYAYQANVIPQIAKGDPTYLGFDPGLGKSRTALEAASARNATRTLVIAPASGRYVWEREVRQWLPNCAFMHIQSAADFAKMRDFRGVAVITYGLLSQKASIYAQAISNGPAWDMTVLDEASAVKNSGSNRTKAILGKMLPKLGYLLPMSGTPAPNHAGELYPILRANFAQALSKSNGTPMMEYEFQDAFCQVFQKPFGPGGSSIRVIEGSKNLTELRRRMNGYMIRVRKEEVLKDLPPIRWDVVPVQPTSDVSSLPSVPPEMTDDDLLKWLSGAGSDHVMRVRRIIGLAKVNASIEYLQDFLGTLGNLRKILVFAHHKDVIASLTAGLGGSKPAVITGETDAAGRKRNIEMFLTDDNCRVFIGNIQAAGTALTLVGPKCRCSDVFFVEASYSVGDNVQAACRVHRIGQQDGVVARFLTAHGTLDDRVQDILARKASDFEALFG